MKKLFLIDAYAIIYRAYYAFIRAPRINSKGLNTSAIYGFVNTRSFGCKSRYGRLSGRDRLGNWTR